MFDVIIGIDPGISGAIAIIDASKGTLEVSVYSTPTKNIIKNKKNKKDYDVEAMSKIIEPYKHLNTVVVQEATHAMPGQGTTSMYSFGRGAGIWEGIVGAYHLKHNFISPVTWKKEWEGELYKKLEKPDKLKVTPTQINKFTPLERKDYKEIKKKYQQDMAQAKKLAKDNARNLAGILYPKLKEEFILKKDDGKAEAVLIAEYLRRQING